jgi:hypothetical protein
MPAAPPSRSRSIMRWHRCRYSDSMSIPTAALAVGRSRQGDASVGRALKVRAKHRVGGAGRVDRQRCIRTAARTECRRPSRWRPGRRPRRRAPEPACRRFGASMSSSPFMRYTAVAAAMGTLLVSPGLPGAVCARSPEVRFRVRGLCGVPLSPSAREARVRPGGAVAPVGQKHQLDSRLPARGVRREGDGLLLSGPLRIFCASRPFEWLPWPSRRIARRPVAACAHGSHDCVEGG